MLSLLRIHTYSVVALLSGTLLLSACNAKSGWQTYQNDALGLKIQYPQEYEPSLYEAKITTSTGIKVAVQGVHFQSTKNLKTVVDVYRTTNNAILDALQADQPLASGKTVNGIAFLRFRWTSFQPEQYGYVGQKGGTHWVMQTQSANATTGEEMLSTFEAK